MLQSLAFYFFLTTVTLRPLKEGEEKEEEAQADFLLMKAIWPRNLFFLFLFLRVKLHGDVAVQILPLFSFSIGLCLASALLAQGGFLFLLGSGFLLLRVFIFLSWQQRRERRRKRPLKASFPSATGRG